MAIGPEQRIVLLERKVASLEQQLGAKAREIERLRLEHETELRTKDEIILKFRNEIQDLRQELQAFHVSHGKEMEALKQKIKEEVTDSFRDLIRDMQTDNDELKKTVAKLFTELNEIKAQRQ
jgi:chromosome segregation ATPase